MDFTDYLNKYFACAGSWFTQSYKNFQLEFDIPPFGNSNVFFLGDRDEYEKSITPIYDDITQDRELFIPMPYKDTSIISHRTTAGVTKMECDRLVRLPEEVKHKLIQILKDGIKKDEIVYGRENVASGAAILERSEKVVSAYLYLDVYESMFELSTVAGTIYLYGGGRLDLHDGNKESLPGVSFCAIPPEARNQTNPYHLMMINNRNKLLQSLGQDALACCEVITSILHPTNYVVKTSPTLTTKERHRFASGHPLSPRKRPYFIIVDHEVLVRMRRGIPAQGEEIDRASPTPHHRRGHWRRLSERCRHARLLGKERIQVREAFIGDTKFSDEKNFYEVMLNFNSKNTT